MQQTAHFSLGRIGGLGLLALCLMVAGGTLGCGDSETAKAARKEAGEAFDAAKDFLADQKERFVAEFEDELEELEESLETLRSRVDQATAGARRDLEDKIRELERKREAALEEITRLKEAGLEHWESFKDGSSRALAEFKKAFEDK